MYSQEVWGALLAPPLQFGLILSRLNVFCSNDFGSFCANQNVVIKPNLAFFLYFQGRASAPLLPMPPGDHGGRSPIYRYNLPPTKKEVYAIARDVCLSVCLSVSKIAQKRAHEVE